MAENKPYFPAFEMVYSLFNLPEIDCGKCEKQDCHSRGAHQRNRPDFTYGSRRCPRLPDMRGFVEPSEHIARKDAYSFVIAERDQDGDHLLVKISVPGKPQRLLYPSKSGYWWYRDKGHRRAVTLDLHPGRKNKDIQDYMDQRRANRVCLPCRIEDFSL